MNATQLDAGSLRATFDAPSRLTIGIEEELMLLDRATLDLAPVAAKALEPIAGDSRFKLELPAAQLEIVTAPRSNVGAAIEQLRSARVALSDACGHAALLATAGVHPFAAPEGELNRGGRYDHIAARFGPIARRQLVFALQVHVAPGGANRALAIYNTLRSYLPELAALAANAPFYAGRDTGLASIRPLIAGALPRQGVPPPIGCWEEYAAALRWGAAAAALPEPNAWWWELRPHHGFGTLEVRVPDAQSTVAEAASVAAFVHCLIAWLGDRFDEGERLPVASSWRIEENRWSAIRDGVDGTMADLITGQRNETRSRLLELVERLGPTASRLGCRRELEHARAMIATGGAMRQRAVAAECGLKGLAVWLTERWLDDRRHR